MTDRANPTQPCRRDEWGHSPESMPSVCISIRCHLNRPLMSQLPTGEAADQPTSYGRQQPASLRAESY